MRRLTQDKARAAPMTQHRARTHPAHRPSLSHPTEALILRAASARFAAQGLHGTTMREIAATVDLHLPSIYHFFANKEALYLRCVALAFERTADHLEARLAAITAGIAARPQLLAFVARLCELLVADAELRAFLIQRHRQGRSWLAGTPLQAVFERFAGHLPAMTGNGADAAHRVERLVGLALGDALGRATRAAHAPDIDPAALLELVSPGWHGVDGAR